MANKRTIYDIRDDLYRREMVLDTLSRGIKGVSKFRDDADYIIDNKLDLFDDDFFLTPIDTDVELTSDENTLIIDLLLPAFRRVWVKVYEDLPDILKYTPNNKIYDKRRELYQNMFIIDDFLEYFKDIVLKTKDCLSDFEYLDKEVEHITLVCNNYIAYLLKELNDVKDINMELRNYKLKKILK